MVPSVGPTHGVQANANAAPAISGPPDPARDISTSGRHSRLSLGTNGVSTNSTPSAMMITPAILSSVPRPSCSVEPSPVAVIPSATKTTVKDRQKTNAGHQDAAEPLLALLDLGQRHAGHGRQVAGHERQHARRDEGDEADREGGDDRGVDAAGHRSKALSSASSRRASSGSSSGPAGALSVRASGAPRARCRARRAPPARRAPARPRGRSRRLGGSASTSGPYSSTSAALICSLVMPSAIRARMNARSWSATGGGGDVQRRAALDAHHLVLDVGQRRLRLGAAAAVQDETTSSEREQRAAARPHAPAAAPGARPATPGSTGPRRIAAIRPSRSIRNVSG